MLRNFMIFLLVIFANKSYCGGCSFSKEAVNDVQKNLPQNSPQKSLPNFTSQKKSPNLKISTNTYDSKSNETTCDLTPSREAKVDSELHKSYDEIANIPNPIVLPPSKAASNPFNLSKLEPDVEYMEDGTIMERHPVAQNPVQKKCDLESDSGQSKEEQLVQNFQGNLATFAQVFQEKADSESENEEFFKHILVAPNWYTAIYGGEFATHKKLRWVSVKKYDRLKKPLAKSEILYVFFDQKVGENIDKILSCARSVIEHKNTEKLDYILSEIRCILLDLAVYGVLCFGKSTMYFVQFHDFVNYSANFAHFLILNSREVCAGLEKIAKDLNGRKIHDFITKIKGFINECLSTKAHFNEVEIMVFLSENLCKYFAEKFHPISE